jgi:hypothetical protein
MSPLNHNLSYVDIVWVEQITNGKIHFCSFFRNFLEYILLDQIGKPTATLPSLVVSRGESYAHYQRVRIPFLPRYTRNRKELGGGSLFRPTFHHHSSKEKKPPPSRIVTTHSRPHYPNFPYLQGAASGYRLPSTPLIGASANLVTFLPGPPLRSGPSGAEWIPSPSSNTSKPPPLLLR